IRRERRGACCSACSDWPHAGDWRGYSLPEPSSWGPVRSRGAASESFGRLQLCRWAGGRRLLGLGLNDGAHACIAAFLRRFAGFALHRKKIRARVVRDIASAHFVLLARQACLVKQLDEFLAAVVLDAQGFAVDPFVSAFAALAEGGGRTVGGCVFEAGVVLTHDQPIGTEYEAPLRENHATLENRHLLVFVCGEPIGLDVDRLIAVRTLRPRPLERQHGQQKGRKEAMREIDGHVDRDIGRTEKSGVYLPLLAP